MENQYTWHRVLLDTKQRAAIISFANKAGKSRTPVHILTTQSREAGSPAEEMTGGEPSRVVILSDPEDRRMQTAHQTQHLQPAS